MAENEVLIETSARHVHVTQNDLEALFGKGAQLTKKKDLSQPGQFASEQRVTVVGPKKELANVSILGPCRSADQVELSGYRPTAPSVLALLSARAAISQVLPGCDTERSGRRGNDQGGRYRSKAPYPPHTRDC